MRPPAVRSRQPSDRSWPGTVRIIGGRWKRTPIRVPDVPGLRPTPDRVRETVFNWIAHLRPDLSALRGLDLFAGSGAMGFELASRGALAVTLVERHPSAVRALRDLAGKLGAVQVQVLAGDAVLVAAGLPARTYDVIFVDPPYRPAALTEALGAVRRLAAPAALVYVEDGRPLDESGFVTLGFDFVRQDRAGLVNFALLSAPGD